MKYGAVHDTEILVARHGETEWNKLGKWQGTSDIPLNSRGVEQAKELAAKLVKEDIRYIYSSNLSRARTTADIVRKALTSFGVFEDARFRERNFGKFEGWTDLQVAKYMGLPEEKAYMLGFDELMIEGLPTVEKWDDVKKRVWESLREIADKRTGARSLVVAHGGVVRAVAMEMDNGAEPNLNFGNTDFVRIRFDGHSFSLIEE